jgi:hypothetical protein
VIDLVRTGIFRRLHRLPSQLAEHFVELLVGPTVGLLVVLVKTGVLKRGQDVTRQLEQPVIVRANLDVEVRNVSCQEPLRLLTAGIVSDSLSFLLAETDRGVDGF